MEPVSPVATYHAKSPPDFVHALIDGVPKSPKEPTQPAPLPQNPDTITFSDKAEGEKKTAEYKKQSEEHEKYNKDYPVWQQNNKEDRESKENWKSLAGTFSQEQLGKALHGAHTLAAEQHRNHTTIQADLHKKLEEADSKIANLDKMDENQCHENVKLRTRKTRYKVAFILLAIATSIAIPVVAFWIKHKLSKMQPRAALANN